MKLLEMFAPSSRQRIMEGIDHPEDLIIAQGSKGADRVIQELSKLESDPSTISIKWDGLPALVWGRDKDGDFQLVDKHQFEKISKGKAEFSTIRAYDEARGANRSSLWAKEDILRPALEAATPQVRDQYWFGDFMYAGTPPVKNGRFVFKPNTVEYRVSEQGELGEKIAASSAGMAVHTFIPGLGSDDQPLVGLKGLDDGAGVVFFLGEIKDKPTVKVDNTILARAQAVVNKHRAAVDKFIADLTEMKGKSVITAMSPFITRMLEEDDISGDIVPRFLEFLTERLTPAAAEKMLGKNKDGWLYQADGGGPGLLGIWTMWAAVTELKISVKQLLDTQMGGSEVQALTDGVDAHEGYVFGAGKDKLKLVDRLGFTKANFARYRVPDEEKAAKAKMPMAAFCFGRMNPPTLGHGLVMEKTIAEGGKDSYIFLSNSQGKDDPLDPATKAAFIKKMYPKFAGHIVDDYVQGPIYAANWLYDRGFRNITFVGGSDRLGKAPGSIEKLLNGWNSGPVRTTDAARGDTGREYVNLRFVSSGDRDPDAAGVTGYSGTKARQAALQGDEMKFWEFTGTKPDLKVGAVNLYQATRAGLGVKDEPTQEDMWSQLDEGVSIDGSVKSIVATGDSIAKVYGDLKTMAEKWVYNNGQLKGFHRNAAGVGKRWYDTFYWGKMENDLRTLLEKNPRGAAKLRDFFNIERDERGHVSFTAISKSLPKVLYQVGERMDSKDLQRFSRNWFNRQKDYEDFLSTVEKRINDEEEDDIPAAASAPRDNVVGRQNAAAEDIVNQILRSIDKKVAGEIRNIIAREPNKLQALQKELAKRNIKVGESIRRMESQGVSEAGVSGGYGYSIAPGKKPEIQQKSPKPNWRINRDGTATDMNSGITYYRDGSVKKDVEEGDLDEDWRKKLAAAGMAGMMAVGGAAGAADRMPEPVKDPIIATLVIDGEARELDLTPLGFKDVKAAESYIKKFMKDRGIMDWQAKIERSQPGTGRYERVRITGAGGLESTEYDNDQTLDEMFDMFGPVSTLEMAVNLLTALSVPMAVMGPVVFNRIKNKIQKMHSRRIIDLLSQKQIKVDKVTKRMLERSLDDLQQALDRDDGEAAKRLALEIRQIARDADDRPVANEDIRKVKGGYRLVSKKSGRNLGTYPTRAGAEKRERQVQFFKHRG